MRYRWRWMAAGAALVASIAGIAWLLFREAEVDGAAMNTRRCAGFEPA